MEYKTFHGKKASDLTMIEKRKAANMINMIEEKINRGHSEENPVIKGRSVFNGRVQRGLYTKEETASHVRSMRFLCGFETVHTNIIIATVHCKSLTQQSWMRPIKSTPCRQSLTSVPVIE